MNVAMLAVTSLLLTAAQPSAFAGVYPSPNGPGVVARAALPAVLTQNYTFQTVDAPAFLKLKAGLLPKVRRIVITGDGSNWGRTTTVSIKDIPIVIPLRVQPTKIIALMVIPSTLTGFTPGIKEAGVATGADLCTGTVDIP